MNLSNQDVQLGQNMFEDSATQKHPLGTRGYTPDGRAYRYAKAGATTIAGEVQQSPATVVGNLAKAVNTTSAVSVGATTISVTMASAVAAGFYNEGYLVIASGAGQGGVYSVNSHALVSTGATGAFRLYDEDALIVAITTTSTVSLLPNKYAGVIQAPVSTATGRIAGVATYVITAGNFGWIQTWGPCAVKGDDTTAIGAPVNGIAGTAGRASGFTAAGLLTGQAIGNLMQAAVAAQWVMVDLTISP